MKPFAFTLLVAGIATSVWPETPLVPVMNEPLAGGQTVSVAVGHALNIAETSGGNVRVHAVYRASRSGGAAERQYDLAPHAQRLIEFSADVGPVEATISVSGEGRVTVWAQAAAAFGAIQDIVSAPFKAAPFYEKATGLIYMRDRWYDPRTGTFLTPDPEGYRDSSNLYIYCAGDPINCSDPTGDAASASRSGVIIGIRPDGKRYRFAPGYGKEGLQHRIEVQLTLEDDPDLSEADVRTIMARAGLQYGPTSLPCLPGETCLRSAAPPRRGDYVAGAALQVSNTTNQILGPVNEVNGERPFPGPDPENERQRAAYQWTRDVIQAITVPATIAGLLPAGVRIEILGDAYNISTAGMSQAERDAVLQYARRTNAWLDEAGSQVIQPTKGPLRRAASAAA